MELSGNAFPVSPDKKLQHHGHTNDWHKKYVNSKKHAAKK